MSKKYQTNDPNYRVDIPAPIKAKITKLAIAAETFAFAGAAPPEDMDGLADEFFTARRDLEQTIKTYLDRSKET